MSPKTVHSHKRSIMKKLFLKKQRELAYWLVSNCNQSI
ncbi:response regulator transcription factor [Serratia marcescens]|nr:response regulator transcription factor [Serratia marcescens]